MANVKTIVLIAAILLYINPHAYSSETCYIDNDPVLLYKIINWWYDCPPGESDRFCGRPLKCQTKGDTRVEYNETDKRMDFRVAGGISGLLSILKECGQCYGPTYLRCTWLNESYFGNSNAVDIRVDKTSFISLLTFKNVDRINGRRFLSIQKDIVIEVEGRVGGLVNGRIALHQAGEFLKKCPKNTGNSDENFPIAVTIRNGTTNEIFVKYSVVYN